MHSMRLRPDDTSGNASTQRTLLPTLARSFQCNTENKTQRIEPPTHRTHRMQSTHSSCSSSRQAHLESISDHENYRTHRTHGTCEGRTSLEIKNGKNKKILKSDIVDKKYPKIPSRISNQRIERIERIELCTYTHKGFIKVHAASARRHCEPVWGDWNWEWRNIWFWVTEYFFCRLKKSKNRPSWDVWQRCYAARTGFGTAFISL